MLVAILLTDIWRVKSRIIIIRVCFRVRVWVMVRVSMVRDKVRVRVYVLRFTLYTHSHFGRLG